MTYAEIVKYTSNLSNIKYQCKKCGRKEVIDKNKEKTLCTHCGHYIFKSEKEEFLYRMRERMANDKVRSR